MDSPNDLIVTGTTTLATPKPEHLAAVKTYNYLRLGMLVAVVALAYSVATEYRQPGVHCFLGSVSGYYYTPVHPIFIGLMVTIGFTLIVMKGRVWENPFLILAGLMAPIVALIPTDDDLNGVCRPEMLAIHHYEPASGSGVIQASINNNLHTLVYAGYTAIALVVIARLLLKGGGKRVTPDGATTFWWFVGGGLVLAITGSVLLHWHYSWVLDGHALAACVMFFLLGLAAIANCVLGLLRHHTNGWYAAMYGAVGGAMIGAGILFVVFRDDAKSSFGGHLVLVIEVVEIFLFAVFWAVQTVERWNQTV